MTFWGRYSSKSTTSLDLGLTMHKRKCVSLCLSRVEQHTSVVAKAEAPVEQSVRQLKSPLAHFERLLEMRVACTAPLPMQANTAGLQTSSYGTRERARFKAGKKEVVWLSGLSHLMSYARLLRSGQQ